MERPGHQVGDARQAPPETATSIPFQELDGSRDERIRKHLPLVRWVALDVRMSRLGRGARLEDLEANGALGLVEAAARFDPTRGIPFTVFAKARIRGAMLDGIRAQHSLGRRAYQRHRASAASQSDPVKRMDFGTEMAGEEALLGIADGARWNGRQMAQLPVTEDDSVKVSLAKELLRLPERQQRLINLCYGQDKSLSEAAREMGIRRSWASRLHARALATLGVALGRSAFEAGKTATPVSV